MSEEDNVNNTPAPEDTNQPEPVPEPVADTTPEPDAKPKETPWYIREIGELRGEKRTLKEQAEKAKTLEEQNKILIEELAKAKGSSATAEPAPRPSPASTLPESEIDRRATEKAKTMAAQHRFDEACNRTVDSGKKDYPDFDDALQGLAAVGAVGPNSNPEFLSLVTNIPDGHKILHHLSKDLNEAARLVRLTPTQMAYEIAKLEDKVKAPKPVSAAPNPIRPVSGTGKVEKDWQEADSVEDYISARDKADALRRR